MEKMFSRLVQKMKKMLSKMFSCIAQNNENTFKYRKNPNYCEKIANFFNFWIFSISNNSYSAIKNIERNINIKVL